MRTVWLFFMGSAGVFLLILTLSAQTDRAVDLLREQLRDHMMDSQRKVDDLEVVKRSLYEHNLKMENRIATLEVLVSNLVELMKWTLGLIGVQLANSAVRTVRAMKSGKP